MRICSLLPSATEIVAELRLVGSLVGISDDWPPEVRGLPVVTCGVRKCVLAANRADSNSGRVCAPHRLQFSCCAGTACYASRKSPTLHGIPGACISGNETVVGRCMRKKANMRLPKCESTRSPACRL